MTYDPVGPLHEGRADAMPAGPADVASQIRAVAARIRPAIRMGSAELRDAHTTRIPQPTASYGRNPSDTGSFGWAVLGFSIPWSGSSCG